MSRPCVVCGVDQPLENYQRADRYKDGHKRRCKTCDREYARAWSAKNREKEAGYRRKTAYGIDPDEYDRLRADQNSCCAICHAPEAEMPKGFCVDHCHATNRVRGLLCTNCNLALGYMKDNPSLLTSAATYVLEHNA